MKSISRPRQQAGFALIITILLMAFLVLLMVSMASLTRVETQIAINSQTTEKARQNALFALNIALGHLQKAAGPDQRITARADILDTGSTTLRNTGGGTAVNQPLWTGVWKTHNENNPTWNLDVDSSGATGSFLRDWSTKSSGASTVRAQNTNMDWLVSGATNPTTNTTINPLSWAATATNSVVLSKTKLTPTATTTLDTAAPLVDIKGTPAGFTNEPTVGKYAYWISDEGVKAKVNIKDSTLGQSSSSIGLNALHFSAPQATAGHKILPSTLSEDFRGFDNVTKVLTPAQLSFVPSTPPSATLYNVSTYLPDITTYSYGVLADVKNGGLKKDLTAALEDSGATAGKNYAKLNSTGYDNVYDLTTEAIPQLNSATSSPGNKTLNNGLKWNSLHTFYNSYKSNLPNIVSGNQSTAGTTGPAGVGNPEASRPYTVDIRADSWRGGAALGSAIVQGTLDPVPVAFQWDIAMGAIPDATGTNYTLQLYYYPQITLYNPCAVRLSASNFRYGCFIQPWGTTAGVVLSDIYAQIAVTTGTAPATTTTTYYAVINQGASNNTGSGSYVGLQTALETSFSMEPGEVRVYGLDKQVAILAAPGLSKANSITTACDYTGGLVSNADVSPTWAVTTPLLVIGSLGETMQEDNYIAGPTIASGSKVTIKLTNRPLSVNASSADASNVMTALGTTILSLPNATAWPNAVSNEAGTKYAVLYTKTGSIITSDGIAVAAGGFGNMNSPALPTATSIDTLTSPQSISLWHVRNKGLVNNGDTTFRNAGTQFTALGMNVPLFHGNSGGVNALKPMNTWAKYTTERHSSTNAIPYANYPPNNYPQTYIVNGRPTANWGLQSAGVQSVDPSGPTRVVLADIPLQPLTSLGQFMHMQPAYFATYGGFSLEPFGSMFTGGSVIPPDINPATTYKQYKVLGCADDSFLINQKLFDGYFLSTVPPASLSNSQVYPQKWLGFYTKNTGATLVDASDTFLNSRIVINSAKASPIQMSDLRDMDKAADNLLLNGAFNVNSTSVAAWKALLYSLSGNDLKLWDATARAESNFTGLNCPIPRFWSATSNSVPNSAWCAVRDLTDLQVTELATKIVTQVKLRGPFLSMGDFLNRRLGPDDKLTRVGALQAAIDTTSPDINATAKAAGQPVTNLQQFITALPSGNDAWQMANAVDGAGTTWNTALGIPGYLMQQDLVQAFSPVMAARSDTFVIRTYGETINPATGTTTSKAYCEAVVQRLPDFVDQTDSATATLGNATPLTSLSAGSINSTFGRRFKVVQFRWLTENDL